MTGADDRCIIKFASQDGCLAGHLLQVKMKKYTGHDWHLF
jgi:hypothetical protein